MSACAVAKAVALFPLEVCRATMSAAFAAMLFVTVVEKLASSPKAFANSLSVSNAPGAPLITFEICKST